MCGHGLIRYSPQITLGPWPLACRIFGLRPSPTKLIICKPSLQTSAVHSIPIPSINFDTQHSFSWTRKATCPIMVGRYKTKSTFCQQGKVPKLTVHIHIHIMCSCLLGFLVLCCRSTGLPFSRFPASVFSSSPLPSSLLAYLLSIVPGPLLRDLRFGIFLSRFGAGRSKHFNYEYNRLVALVVEQAAVIGCNIGGRWEMANLLSELERFEQEMKDLGSEALPHQQVLLPPPPPPPPGLLIGRGGGGHLPQARPPPPPPPGGLRGPPGVPPPPPSVGGLYGVGAPPTLVANSSTVLPPPPPPPSTFLPPQVCSPTVTLPFCF